MILRIAIVAIPWQFELRSCAIPWQFELRSWRHRGNRIPCQVRVSTMARHNTCSESELRSARCRLCLSPARATHDVARAHAASKLAKPFLGWLRTMRTKHGKSGLVCAGCAQRVRSTVNPAFSALAPHNVCEAR